MIFKTSSPGQTLRLGYSVGEKLFPHAVICLIGPLGSGKTVFVQGVTQGLKAKSKATSPSFTLIHEYGGHLPIYHFDLYRVKGLKDLEDIGYREYFYGDGVTIIEWAEKIRPLWPKKHLEVYFQFSNRNKRKIELISSDREYQNIIKRLTHSFGLQI